MNNKVYDLPIIISGQRIDITDNMDVETISYETGVTIRIPKLDDELVKKIELSSNDLIHQLTLEEVTLFLSKIGAAWVDPDYPLRKQAIELSTKITGYDECFLVRDLDMIADYMRLRAEMYDQFEVELGSIRIIDEWIHQHECMIHAEPRGKLLHIMVGNIPIASLYSLVRGILTKNNNVAKLPSRDMSTCLFFLLSFIDLYPDHPITKSISAVYWKRDNHTVEQRMIDSSNAVCIWGGEEAVKSIKRKIPPKTEVIELGPKKSLSIINLDSIEDMDKTACRLANDVSIYNQEACFASQMAFVKGTNLDEFIDKLEDWLNRTAKRWPTGFMTFDNNAHVYINKLKETYLGNRVIASPENDWCIVICNNLDYAITEHPLSRTIYIYQIEDISQVYKFIDDNVQAVGLDPWELAFECKDELSKRGVSRICELGLHGLPRIGFVHDSVFPISRMVRFVSLEAPLKIRGKYMEDIEEEEFLCYGFYKDKEHLKILATSDNIPSSYFDNILSNI